jgi:hypothetical protein
MNNEELRLNRWDVVDASDVVEVCDDILSQSVELNKLGDMPSKWAEGFVEAVQDLKHAAEMNGKDGVDLHLMGWSGFVARSANDHGYMGGLEAVQDTMNKLILDRSI